MKEISGFLISASGSGTGKTTLALGLIRALRNRGLNVQPYKCGPDYIDIKFHEAASGNNCINLDLFFSSGEHIREIYTKHSKNCDVTVVEGVMGLFDGYDKMEGSSAQIAETLNLPVIFVVNAKAVAFSAAPLLYGFKNFYPNVKIAGVIFNFVASESHYSFLQEAAALVGIKALGYLPKNLDIEIPSRHLGLSLNQEYRTNEMIERAASLVEEHIDIDTLCDITKIEIDNNSYNKETANNSSKKMKISIAKDEAFNFVYHENIDYLKSIGNVTFFSPLKDNQLPDSDLLYFPGGYPELFLQQLCLNTSLINQIKEYAEGGGKIFAECGGMMYLSSYIEDENGIPFSMCDIFKQDISMCNMKLTLGYRRFGLPNSDDIFKGHEFHYSHAFGDLRSVTQQYNAKGLPVGTKLIRYKNVIGSYTHLYWAESKNILKLFD